MKLSRFIHTARQLRDRLGSAPERLDEVIAAYPMRITPLMEELIRQEGEGGPIGRQFIPSSEELEDPVGLEDPLAEEEHSPVPNLVHRYPDRALLLVTNECAVYCRFCTRKRRVGHPMHVPRDWLQKALTYIADTPMIRDVLISGGDPLLLSDAKLSAILESLVSIPHVEVLRVGTRIPFVLPERVTPELVEILRRSQPTFVMLHVNHPAEVTPEAELACRALADAGIPLFAQIVLLRGVNDTIEVLRPLLRRLLQLRVRPYQLMQGDLTCGTDHFRTPIQTGLDIMNGLQGHISGIAVPELVVDLPGGGGKVPLHGERVIRRSPRELVVVNYRNQVYRYPEPGVRSAEQPPALASP